MNNYTGEFYTDCVSENWPIDSEKRVGDYVKHISSDDNYSIFSCDVGRKSITLNISKSSDLNVYNICQIMRMSDVNTIYHISSINIMPIEDYIFYSTCSNNSFGCVVRSKTSGYSDIC